MRENIRALEHSVAKAGTIDSTEPVETSIPEDRRANSLARGPEVVGQRKKRKN